MQRYEGEIAVHEFFTEFFLFCVIFEEGATKQMKRNNIRMNLKLKKMWSRVSCVMSVIKQFGV
jgi:hypothetical protein